MERTKELLGDKEGLNRLIIEYSNSALKLENSSKRGETVLQKYTRIEYPWTRRERYSKRDNGQRGALGIGLGSNPTKLREGTYDFPNLRAVFPSSLVSGSLDVQKWTHKVEDSDKMEKLEKDFKSTHPSNSISPCEYSIVEPQKLRRPRLLQKFQAN